MSAAATPYQALDAATRAPSAWIGVAGDRGTIEAGKRADPVLLEASPLADITSTRKITAVITNGRWISRREIDAKLADRAKRYAAAP